MSTKPSALVSLALLLALASCALMPTGPSDALRAEVVGPYGIDGYRSVHALFYVVPVEGGVVLVDTGMDEGGEVLLPAIGAREVLAVLITHAHRDHWSGAHLLGDDVPVYVHPADQRRIRGEELNQGWLNNLIDRVVPLPTAPSRMVDVDDGAVLELGGETFRAISLPGHTPGSVAYLYRDVLFAGDAVLADGEGVGLSPGAFSDDNDLAAVSLRRLSGLEVSTLLDGHAGRSDGFEARLAAFGGETSGP